MFTKPGLSMALVVRIPGDVRLDFGVAQLLLSLAGRWSARHE